MSFFYLTKAKSQKVILPRKHKDYAWLPFKFTVKSNTFNKNLFKKAEKFLNKRNKGLTMMEILIVLLIILILWGITIEVFRPQGYLITAKDIRRISDLRILESALKTYLTATPSPNLGPANKGIDESSSTIFISVPFDKEDVRTQILIWNGKTYYFSQVDSKEYFKKDGNGWIPVNFTLLPYPQLSVLPVDPLNSYGKKFFYSYVFNRTSSTFEINANLEFIDYDKSIAADGGDNQNIYEVGNDLNLMPNNLYY